MEKKIWFVVEQGAGLVRQAFESKDEAIKFAEELKVEEDMDCFEVLPVWYKAKN